jgi:hypothetical protein
MGCPHLGGETSELEFPEGPGRKRYAIPLLSSHRMIKNRLVSVCFRRGDFTARSNQVVIIAAECPSDRTG